jgi:glycerol-3-phosphate dehydrogenase (NAD+)
VPLAQNFKLPRNVRATTDAQEAIAGASYAVHAVPVQHSRAFLSGIREVLPPKVPIVCVSKGLEVGSGCMMSEVIPGALGRRQPAVFISGPSFAKEVMQVSGWELQEGPVWHVTILPSVAAAAAAAA